MITIKYRNKLYFEITELQALQSDIYSKEFIIENKLKKIEHYSNGDLTYLEYFLGINETVSQTRLTYPNLEITFYKNEYEERGYRKYDVEDYNLDGTISVKRVEILDSKNDIIYSKILDLDTNDIIAISKSSYDEEGNYLYEFEYNLDGTLNQVDIMIPDDYHPTGTFYPQDIGVNPEVNFTWDGYEYYQNAEPEIPND